MTAKQKTKALKKLTMQNRSGEIVYTGQKSKHGLGILRLLCMKPFRVNQLASRLGISERTVYRQLTVIQQNLDVQIDKDFNNKYFLAQDHCPLCGATTNNHYETKIEGSSVQID